MSALMRMHVVRLTALTVGAAMPSLPIRAAFIIRSLSPSRFIVLRAALSDNEMLTGAVFDLQSETGAWRGTHSRGRCSSAAGVGAARRRGGQGGSWAAAQRTKGTRS